VYTQFYSLAEKPFGLTPDPRFHYKSQSHREALASIIYGINERKGLILIVGEVGTGKTLVMRSLLSDLDKWQTRVIYLFNTPQSFDELLIMCLSELGISYEGMGRHSMLKALNAYLLKCDSKGSKVTLIIDEAQNLSYKTLEELQMLSTLEKDQRKLLQIVLIGQPELDMKLKDSSMKQLRARIAVRSELQPLGQEEVEAYLYHRLRVAGNGSRIFSRSALKLVRVRSHGIPRAINVICDNALLIGYAIGRKQIGKSTIEEVIKDLDGNSD